MHKLPSRKVAKTKRKKIGSTLYIAEGGAAYFG